MNRNILALSLFVLPVLVTACSSPMPSTDAGDAAVMADSAQPDIVGADTQPGTDVVTPTDTLQPEDVTAATDAPVSTDVTTPTDSAVSCVLGGAMTYGPEGGRIASRVSTTLTAPTTFTRSREYFDGRPTVMCTTELTGCATAGTITVADINAALAHPDVVAAFMRMGTTFGRDTRPVDGSVFVIRPQGGAGINVGEPCAGSAGCTEIPPGLATLVSLLQSLDTQEVARPGCEMLR